MRIYVASKAKHGPLWRRLRSGGLPIISTWIDESEPGQTYNWQNLWYRCVEEASTCTILLLYQESPDEKLKGALVETGCALGRGIPVITVGVHGQTFQNHRLVTSFNNLHQALIRLEEWKQSEESSK